MIRHGQKIVLDFDQGRLTEWEVFGTNVNHIFSIELKI
jgi:hypothetical protein